MTIDPITTDAVEAPAETISPGLRRKLQSCFDHAAKLSATDKYDHDYVHTLLSECVANDPGNLVYVEAMLTNLQRKFKNNKRGSRFGGKGAAVKKLVTKKEWREALKVGLESLKANPWDVTTLRAMAEACEGLRYNEVELRYLKNALEGSPRDPEVSRHCAKTLTRVGQFDQAIACWHRVEDLKRGDPEAPKAISDLTLEKARIQAGIGRDEAAAGVKPVSPRPDR